MDISKWQSEFIKRFDDELVIARTGISSGKTRILAIWLVMQSLQKPGIRGIIIAQTYRALHKVLIREIQVVAQSLNVSVSLNKSSSEITFPNGSQLFGYSAENPDALLGLTEIAILAIDEAAYCNEEIYNNARDRMRGSRYKSMVRLISSPQSMASSNYFSSLCKKHSDCVITATALDNPFTSAEFKQELKNRYGEGTNLYRQQVLGELFDTDLISQIIKRSEFPDRKTASDNRHFLGFDASGLGIDTDCFVSIDRFGVIEYRKEQCLDTLQKTSLVSDLEKKYGYANKFADGTGGYSNGVCDLLRARGIDISQINFAQKAYDSEKYPNSRTEMYLEAVKTIKEGFWIPEEAREEFLAQQSFINNRGQIALVPKEDVKRIIGRSPDLADAICLAIYSMNHCDAITYSSEKNQKIALRFVGI